MYSLIFIGREHSEFPVVLSSREPMTNKCRICHVLMQAILGLFWVCCLF